MADADVVAQLRHTWETAAPGWAKWEPVWARTLADATEQMLDAAGVAEAMRVLDVACGAGSQTLRAAGRVGAHGRVVATDISATMLAHVRRTAAAEGLDNVETLEGAAEELALAGAGFDAAICRLGVMLFAAPTEAVSAVQHALRPGGRFAALVFTTPANNDFMASTMAILRRHAGMAPPPPGTPGLFALGEEGVLANTLAAGGLTDVRTTVLRATLRFDDVDAALRFFQEAGGAYRAVAETMGEADRARAWEAVRDRVSEFSTGDGVADELEFVIGSGARPT